MPSSESLRADANNLDQSANDLLMEATAIFTAMTAQGQQIDEPFLSEILEILARDDLVGDLDRLSNLIDNLDDHVQERRIFIFRRYRHIREITADLDNMIDLLNQTFHNLLRLLEAYGKVEAAKAHRAHADAFREFASNLESEGL